jgi:chromosome partitioning protein
MAMNTTLVVNAKGGVGKTTVTTNLASYFASRGVPTTIADYDPQGSSLNWLKQRPANVGKIHGADLSQRHGVGLSTARREIPRDTRVLILDAPAGPSRLLLQDLLGRCQTILIPVAPSAIDVHATANFIKELLLVGHVKLRNIRVAVLANRVRSTKPVFEPLERFVASLDMMFVARLSDSDAYVDAAEAGVGVFDLPSEKCSAEQREFLPIARWVQGDTELETAVPSNVIPLRFGQK